MSTSTRTVTVAVRFAASLILMVIGVAWLGGLGSGPLSLPGKIVSLAGVAGLVYATVQWARSRRDPYDLSRLWDEPPAPPEEPDQDTVEDALVLCHRCGASMPAHVGICLDCGNRLGY